MLRYELSSRDLAGGQGVQRRSGIAPTDGAVAFLVNGPKVSGKLLVLELEQSVGNKSSAEPCSAGGIHAVEHVRSEAHAHDDVQGISNAHDIARLVHGQTSTALGDDWPKGFLVLTAGEPAYSIPVAMDSSEFLFVSKKKSLCT